MLVFVKGKKPENPERKPQNRERTNNKLKPHETQRTGIEPGSQRWDWGELLSTAQPVPPIRLSFELSAALCSFSGFYSEKEATFHYSNKLLRSRLNHFNS